MMNNYKLPLDVHIRELEVTILVACVLVIVTFIKVSLSKTECMWIRQC